MLELIFELVDLIGTGQMLMQAPEMGHQPEIEILPPLRGHHHIRDGPRGRPQGAVVRADRRRVEAIESTHNAREVQGVAPGDLEVVLS